jgi:hypothetical protein
VPSTEANRSQQPIELISEEPQIVATPTSYEPNLPADEHHAMSGQFGRVLSKDERSPLRYANIGIPKLTLSEDRKAQTEIAIDDVTTIAIADEDGRFTIGANVTAPLFVVHSASHGPVLFERKWLSDDPMTPLELQLESSARLTGTVLNHVGIGIGGCRVHLLSRARDMVEPAEDDDDSVFLLRVVMNRTTDAQGNVDFSQFPSNVPFCAEVRSTEHVLRDANPIFVAPGKAAAKVWRIGGQSTIFGRVVDQMDRPVIDQLLWISQRGINLSSRASRAFFDSTDSDLITDSVVTDKNGTFNVDGLGRGRWWIGIAPLSTNLASDHQEAAQPIAPVAEAIDIDRDDARTDIVIRASRGAYIRGRMVDPDGNPAPGYVWAHGATQGFSGSAYSTSSDTDGTFSIGPLELCEYFVNGDPDPFSERGTTLAPSIPLRVAPGEDVIRIELRRGGTIRPKAIRPDTGSEVVASFCLVSQVSPHTTMGTGTFGESTMEDSGFVGLIPGSYNIAAVTPDGRAGFVSGIVVGAAEIVDGVCVPVKPGARVRCSYRSIGMEMATVSIWVGSVYYGGASLDCGATEVFVVPCGKIMVQWNVGSIETHEECDLALGETRQVTWNQAK